MPVIFGVPISKCNSYGEDFDAPIKSILYVVLRKEIYGIIYFSKKRHVTNLY